MRPPKTTKRSITYNLPLGGPQTRNPGMSANAPMGRSSLKNNTKIRGSSPSPTTRHRDLPCQSTIACDFIPPMAARDQLWGALASLKVCLSRPVGLAKRQILPPQPPILAISARATQKGRLSRLGDNQRSGVVPPRFEPIHRWRQCNWSLRPPISSCSVCSMPRNPESACSFAAPWANRTFRATPLAKSRRPI